MEGSHNGIAAVLKTADRKVMRVRLPHPPPEKNEAGSLDPAFVVKSTVIRGLSPLEATWTVCYPPS